jgi:hypothetical protein
MRNPTWPLQVAIKQRADAQITKYPVYDGVPENEPKEYIVLGEYDFINESDKTADYVEIRHTITCWSQYDGTKQICAMLDEVMRAFDGFYPDLSASDFEAHFQRWEQGKIARYDRDGTIYRYGTITFRYIIKDYSRG